MGHKRKRQEDPAAADQPKPKKQATETSNDNTAAERRQKRSERKPKKAQDPSTSASKDGKKDRTNKKSKSTSQPAAVPGLIKASSTTTDKLAQGKDFISLTESTDAGTTTTPSLQPKATKKAKSSSPRSERKKAKSEAAKAPIPGNDDLSTADKPSTKSTTDPRFIAFVGNLPYTTTTAQLTSHFRKLTPTSIRHPTDKTSGKSKGYAFLEFDNYSSMKTCLKVYHHSMFDPERTARLPADAFDENGLEIVKPGQETRKGSGRRINVELTAGGGGKGEGRKEKIRVKNTRLEEQRDRRREAETKAEKAKYKKRGFSDANAVEVQEKAPDTRGDIHPSRLKRVTA